MRGGGGAPTSYLDREAGRGAHRQIVPGSAVSRYPPPRLSRKERKRRGETPSSDLIPGERARTAVNLGPGRSASTYTRFGHPFSSSRVSEPRRATFFLQKRFLRFYTLVTFSNLLQNLAALQILLGTAFVRRASARSKIMNKYQNSLSLGSCACLSCSNLLTLLHLANLCLFLTV